MHLRVTFATKDEARAHIQKRLTALVGAALAAELSAVDDLIDELIEGDSAVAPTAIRGHSQTRALTPAFIARAGIRYAIRDSDVDLVGDVILASVSGADVADQWLGGASPRAAAVLALVAASAVWFRKVVRALVPVTPSQLLVLHALRKNSTTGMTVDELKHALEWMNAVSGNNDAPLDESKIELALKELSSVSRNDLVPVRLVEQTVAGKWRALEV